MGKRKIVIEEIKDDRQRRSVTFTKRRDGLFKKAETASLKFGGLQIGIVAFSPAGKPFTFTNSSSSLSLDQIIHTYMSSSNSSGSTSSSSAVVMGKKRSRSDEDDDDDVQVIETEEKKKKRKTMNDVVTPPPLVITIEEEEDEKLDQGFHWDHYQNLDSDQTTHDQELRNEFMFSGENAGIVTEEEMTMESSSQFLVEGGNSYSWPPPPDVDVVVQLPEIVNVEDDDFEYADDHHHCDLLPPPAATTPTATSTSTMGFCDLLLSASDNDEEDDGYTLEEWDQILSTSPTTVVDDTSSYMNQEQVEVEADNWPTQEFVQLLCS